MHLRLLELDDSLDGGVLRAAAPWDGVSSVDLRDLAPRLRLWSRAATIAQARARLGDAPGPAVTMIGSGDFHHLAVLLLERAAGPLTVVHFDNHPDWVRWAPRWHCGSWVNRALELPAVRRVVTLGPCSEDLTRPEWKGGNVAALGAGRIALFPWQHDSTRVWRAVGDGPGHRRESGWLRWHNLAEHDAAANATAVLAAIDTEAVWLTIDKDVLAPADALTNWDQGEMPLAALLGLVRAIGARRRIVGADVCGEFSAPVLSNVFKRIESRIDRPQHAADAARLRRNAEVDAQLLRTIAGAAAC